MEIRTIDALGGQRAVLEAPAEARRGLFRERVVEPLRPFWEPFVGRGMPGFDPDAPRFMGIYGPEDDPVAGLAGLGTLDRAGSNGACLAALREAGDVLGRAARAGGREGTGLARLTFALVMTAPRPGDEAGYSGFGNIPGLVMVTVWPSERNLPKLPAAAAHELNHGVRALAQPGDWPNGVSVGEYAVLEGLAEAFAADLVGQDRLGPWAQALTDEQIEAVRPRFREGLEVTGFDQVRGYIFGDWAAGEFGYQKQGLPDFAGYTVGYRIVRGYMARSGRSAAEATYRPWREIVAGSGFF
jgi:uncharacterized protein YjaZ